MAKFTEWCAELEAALKAPFPKELHKQKDKKGTHVPVHAYVARLNELVGISGWSMPQPSSYHSGSKLGLAVGITILGLTKWNVGDEMEDHGEPIEYTDDNGKVREKVVDFGSSSTNSFAQAFKRCCAFGFGLGLYLYDKDWTKAYLAGRTPAPVEAPAMATKAQINKIALLSEQRDVPKEASGKLSQEVNGPLTFARAAKIIERLESLPVLQDA